MNNTGNPVEPNGSSDPKDLQDNAQVFDLLINGPAAEVTSRTGDKLKAWSGFSNDLDSIITSLDTASFTFQDEAAGISGTENGQYFRVPQPLTGNSSFNYYRNNAGVALLVARVAGNSIISNIVTSVGLTVSQPNLFSNNVSDLISLPPYSNAVSAPTFSSSGGINCFKMSTVIQSVVESGARLGTFDASKFSSGLISASVNILAVDASTGGASLLRFIVIQYDSSGAEILAARKSVTITTTAGISDPQQVYIPSVAKSDQCATVAIYLGITTGNGAVVRNVYFKDLLISNGSNAIFRRVPVTDSTITSALAQKAFWNPKMNAYPDSRMKNESVGSYASRWSGGLFVKLANKAITLEAPISGITSAAVGYNDTPIDISGFSSGIFSAAVDIEQKIGNQGVNSSGMNNLRVRIWARDSAGNMLPLAWVDVAGNDDPNTGTGGSARQYYTRYVPLTDITSRTRLIIAAGVKVPTGATSLVFNLRAESTSSTPCPQMYLTNWVLRDGADTSWTESDENQSSKQEKAIFISTTGDDLASGTASAPMKTLAAAVAKINGHGTVNVAPGAYPGDSMQLPMSSVVDLHINGLTDSGFNYPIIRFGSPLTGITKLAGYSRIYSAALTGYASGTHPAWMWLDGVPDADTLITDRSKMNEYLRGMENRLECTKIWLTTATDKTAALAEMDASNSPKCRWVESEGRVYFTLPNAGDATATGVAIYAPKTWTALFTGSGTVFSSGGRISITGIKVRYATINTVGFRETVLRDVHSLGGPQNGADLGGWTQLYNCRFQGVGSSNIAGTYDGANAHNFCVLEHYNCYFSDNVDDGISSHENCYEMGWAPIAEFNLGSGLTPAYGCQATYYHPYTRGNALQTRKVNGKRAGIESHQSPLSSDPGFATTVTVWNGISDGDYNGFWSGDTADSSVAAIMRCFNCVSINPMVNGYSVTYMMDCRHSGTGTPRKAGTNTPVNTSIVS